MSFYDWLIEFKEVNLPIGDLAKDVEQDSDFPKKTSAWNEIENHLSTRANWEVIEIAHNAFDYYSTDMLDD